MKQGRTASELWVCGLNEIQNPRKSQMRNKRAMGYVGDLPPSRENLSLTLYLTLTQKSPVSLTGDYSEKTTRPISSRLD